MIFFSFVNRWYVEMDPFLLWLSFAAAIFIHWFDFKSAFIKGDDEETMKKKELIDAILLSYQFTFLWYKIIDSLKATKTYGGFLRTIIVIFRKMFLVIVFFFCFILLMTGVFNLLFQQTVQFQSYFDSFFQVTFLSIIVPKTTLPFPPAPATVVPSPLQANLNKDPESTLLNE